MISETTLLEENKYYKVWRGKLDIPIDTKKIPFPSEVFKTDLDNDGLPDFLLFGLKFPFSKNSPSVPVHFIKNLGQGKFLLDSKNVLGNLATLHARHLLSKDLNGDGRQDIIYTDHGIDLDPFKGGRTKILLNEEGRKLKTIYSSKKSFSFYTSIGDFNNDKRLDLFINNISFHKDLPKSKIILQRKDGTFYHSDIINQTYFGKTTRQFLSTMAIDYDKDGDLDLFLGGLEGKHNYENQTDLILINDNGKFINILKLPKRYKDETWGTVDVLVSDINHDSWPDLVVATHNDDFSQGAIQIYLNQEGKSFISKEQDIIKFNQLKNYWMPWLLCEDIDNDGHKEILFNIRNGSKKETLITAPLRIYQYSAKGLFEESDILPSNKRRYSSIHAFDYNNDGKFDLFTTDFNLNYFIYERK